MGIILLNSLKATIRDQMRCLVYGKVLTPNRSSAEQLFLRATELGSESGLAQQECCLTFRIVFLVIFFLGGGAGWFLFFK